VVEKLLTRYEDYFLKNKLGEDIFITLRSPNPRVEKNQGKILLETLESIPRNFDVAEKFYGTGIAPIFEVAIPMTSSSEEIFRVKDYYNKQTIGKENNVIDDISIKNWVGEFKPKDINVIPLIEDKTSMLRADKIIEEYIEKAKIQEHQRVWLARSDPALNYGNLSAILINKISLQKIHHLEEKSSVDLYPIIGCGSAPFRGNFRPTKMDNILKSYPSVQTFTMQSAFKYDYSEEQVRESVNLLENTKVKNPMQIDENLGLKVIEKVSSKYQEQIYHIAPLVNKISNYIPQRRKRKLHIGLLGYSRKSGTIKLPRAIKFCASLYSLGLPPEILGLSSLNDKDFDFIDESTASFNEDTMDALKFLNIDNLDLFPLKLQDEVKETLKRFDGYEINKKHKKITDIIANNFKKNNLLSVSEDIERAASIRNFLG
ncbi:phosphoenolpyruvate carboxylase, partial [archaeon]|nr:phosphoenolpyruvate carboxylase [archaeon]